jgi:hypothetical protein
MQANRAQRTVCRSGSGTAQVKKETKEEMKRRWGKASIIGA